MGGWSVSRKWLFALAVVACWSPAILAQVCIDNPSTALNIRMVNKNKGKDVNGNLRLTFDMQGANSQLTSIITDAIAHVEGKTALKVDFIPDQSHSQGLPSIKFRYNDEMSKDFLDPCAYTDYKDGGDTQIYYSSYMNSAAASANSTQRAHLVLLMVHEITHVLGLKDAGFQASGTIMTNYNRDSNDCLAKAAQAQYPSDGLTNADISAAAKCVHGTTEEPGTTNGDDGQQDWYQVPQGGSCNWTLQLPIYTSYAEDCGSGCVNVTGYVSGYYTLDIGGDCGGPPPI